MAKGKKTGGRDFPKGVSGNPGGQSGDPAVRAMRRLTRAEIADAGSMLLDLKRSDFEKMAKDPECSMLRTVIAGIALAAAKGNPTCFRELMTSIVGKPKERIEVSGSVGVKTRYDVMTDEELKALAASKAASLKKYIGG